MPAPLIIPAAIGGAMAVGGIAASIKGARTKANPRRSYYGGSQEALDATRTAYNEGIQSGQGQVNAGLQSIGQGVESAQGVAQQGQDLYGRGGNYLDQANAQFRRGSMVQNDALRHIGAAARGEAPSQAEAMLAANADDAARRGMALASTARGGNQASAMRSAAMAGSQGALAAGQQAAALRAAEMAQARGELAALGQGLYAQGQIPGQMGLSAIGQGLGAQQFGANALMGAGQFTAGLGAGREASYLGAQQNVEQSQLAAQLDYDRRRQAEAQRRSDRWWDFGGRLISGGGSVAASAFGGR